MDWHDKLSNVLKSGEAINNWLGVYRVCWYIVLRE
jgi:hypothetical protein